MELIELKLLDTEKNYDSSLIKELVSRYNNNQSTSISLEDFQHILDTIDYILEHGETLETLPLDVYTGYTDMFGEDVYQAISLETCLNNRAVVGGPSPKIEMENIHRINQKVSGYCD